jgi:hypothetical protein
MKNPDYYIEIGKRFIQLCYEVYIIVEKNVIPIEFDDLLISIKRKLKEIEFSKNDISLACKVINSICLSSNGYYLSFASRLSRI